MPQPLPGVATNFQEGRWSALTRGAASTTNRCPVQPFKTPARVGNAQRLGSPLSEIGEANSQASLPGWQSGGSPLRPGWPERPGQAPLTPGRLSDMIKRKRGLTSEIGEPQRQASLPVQAPVLTRTPRQALPESSEPRRPTGTSFPP